MKSKDIRKIVICFVVLTLFLLGGGYAAHRGYVSLRQSRLIKQAKTHIANSKDKKALLCLQRALRANPKDVDAARLMADLAEKQRSPAALVWRNRVVELVTDSTDDRLALARTALSLREIGTATNALEGINDAGKKTAAYHNLAGGMALMTRQLPDAEKHFIEAFRLEPTNRVLELNLAVVHLQQTNSATLAEARSTLQRLSAVPALSCQALRELAGDAIRNRQTNQVLGYLKRLEQQTNSVFSDKLLQLEILREIQSPEFPAYLATLQREAAKEPGKVFEMGTWQMLKTGPGPALAWLDGLSSEIKTNQPAALMIAECQVTLSAWPALQASLEKQNWGELEFLRHAFQSRAMRAQELTGAAKGEWEMALKSVGGQKGSVVMLLRLAAQWNWASEAEELLWTLVNRDPKDKAAFRTLVQALYAGGRTRPLMTLFSQELKRSPADLAIKNNLAMTALLLEAKELKPYDLASEVYQKSPTNSTYASTYAFSLYVQEKHAEALKILEQLPSQELEKPSIAGYYGILLQATGNGPKAKKYLDLASKGTFLPEEKKLMDQARRMKAEG